MLVKITMKNKRFSAAMGAIVLLVLLVAGHPSTGSGYSLRAAGAVGPLSRVGVGPTGSFRAATIRSKPGTVEVGGSVKNDVSPALRTLRPLANKQPALKEMLEKPSLAYLGGGAVVDPVVQRVLSPLSMPTPVANFAGIGFVNAIPPDPTGDVGPDHYVQWVNSRFEIFTKTGVSVYGPADGNTLWTGFGGPCETRNDGDPVVQYDPLAQRWVLTQYAMPGGADGYYQCFAVSLTSDPTSSYYRYAFRMSPSVYHDYPKLGVWPDAYYMSTVDFDSADNYLGPSAIAFDRAAMLAGAPATFQRFTLSNQYNPILPADLDGSNPPPPAAPGIFATFQPTSTLEIWKFHVDWASPASSSITGPTLVSVAPFNSNLGGILQPYGPTLDSLADRPMYRLAYRNFEDHQALLMNHSVRVSDENSLRSGVRWYELRDLDSTPTLYQEGTYAPDEGQPWMGSVAMDHVGNIGLGYSATGSTWGEGPLIRYTGRLFSDPLGEMSQGVGTIRQSGGPQMIYHRWGDYSTLSVDPSDDCTFWYTNEYIPSIYVNWETQVGAFRFPNCTALGTPTVTPTPSNTPLPTMTPTPTSTTTPGIADAYAQLQPGGVLTVTVGSKLLLDLQVAAGSNSVVAAQSYLTFTQSLLQNVDILSPGCVLTGTVQPDSASFDTVLQNEVCNSAQPCDFGRIVAPPGSIAFASAAISHSPASGTFRVGQVALCATAPGQALVHWQFSPPAPLSRNSEITDASANLVSNPALYRDITVNIVTGTQTATPTATRSATPTAPRTATATSTVQPVGTPTGTQTPGTLLVGHVTWQGPLAQPSVRQQLPLTLTLCVAGTPVAYAATTDSSGFFTITTSLPTGSYNWRVKGPKYLATTGTALLTAGVTTQVEMGLQRAGDTDNTHNNVVNTTDFSVVKGAFGTANTVGDLNNDGVTNTTDFNLLKGNFGQAGAAANCP